MITDAATPPTAIATPTNTAASVATTTPTSDGGASSAVVLKPGMTTSEFIVTILIIAIGSTLASGVIVNNTALQIAGVAMATLKAIAYTWSRTEVKTAIGLAGILFFAHTQTGCTWFRGHVEPIVVDCAKENATSIAALLLTLKADVPDWSKVEADAIDAIPAYGYKVAGCVIGELVQSYMTAPASPTDTSTAARNVFEDFRAKHANGSTFHVNGVDL